MAAFCGKHQCRHAIVVGHVDIHAHRQQASNGCCVATSSGDKQLLAQIFRWWSRGGSPVHVSHGAGCDAVDAVLLMPYAGNVMAQELAVPLTEKEDELCDGDGGGCKANAVSFDTKSSDEYYPVTVKQTFNDGRGRHPTNTARQSK